jgi:hemerythrin-like domain-containing protein
VTLEEAAMSGPMSMYLYIHGAILSEVADIEAAAKELKWDDQSDVRSLGERLDWFRTMTRRHEDSEEEVLFPALNGRIEFVAETYAFDHDDFEHQVFQGITEAMTGLARSTASSDLRHSGEQLYRESVALHEHMRLHISKENELLLPHLEAEFDIAEQAQIAGAMAGMFDPQLMAQAVDFTYRWHSAADREAMLRFLHSILPPPAYQGLTDYLRANNEQSWPDTEHRLADLAG